MKQERYYNSDSSSSTHLTAVTILLGVAATILIITAVLLGLSTPNYYYGTGIGVPPQPEYGGIPQPSTTFIQQGIVANFLLPVILFVTIINLIVKRRRNRNRR